MMKRAATLIFSLTLLGVSVGLLLIYFLFEGKRETFVPLTLSCSDITLYVGQNIEEFYFASLPDAEVSFSVNKDGIIRIDEKQLFAVNPGFVQVTITATAQGQIAKNQFNVTVMSYGYSFEIVANENCHYENSRLVMEENACQFQVLVYNPVGEMCSGLAYQASATNNGKIQFQLYAFILFATQDCTIQIYYPEIDFLVQIEVVCESK